MNQLARCLVFSIAFVATVFMWYAAVLLIKDNSSTALVFAGVASFGTAALVWEYRRLIKLDEDNP